MHARHQQPDTTRQAYTVGEVATRNCVSRGLIYAEISRGRLRSYRIGRTRRISAEAERDWIARLEAEGGA